MGLAGSPRLILHNHGIHAHPPILLAAIELKATIQRKSAGGCFVPHPSAFQQTELCRSTSPLKGRASKKEPGAFRRSQNWVGGTRPGNALFVSPPPDQVLECLGALEKFLHNDPVKTPLLIKAALAHVHFETIHPFLDGNGRLGRLLITFLFCAEGVLREPLLYLSLYFKQHRQQYYDLLQSVRLTGDWEAWLRFFLTGVEETANQAGQTAKALMKLAAADEKRIQTIGKASGSALRVHRLLQAQPILSIASAGEELKLSVPTVTASLKHLAKLGVARETTGRN
jgi:Fic family protein